MEKLPNIIAPTAAPNAPLLGIDLSRDTPGTAGVTKILGVHITEDAPDCDEEGFSPILEMRGIELGPDDAHFLATGDGAFVVSAVGHSPYRLRIEMDEGTKVVCTGRLRLSIAPVSDN